MSWIDGARLKIAKRKAVEGAVAEAKLAEEAKQRAAHEAAEAKAEAKARDRFTRFIKKQVPDGIELVSVVGQSVKRGPVYITVYMGSSERKHYAVSRVDVGKRVQFDVVRETYELHSSEVPPHGLPGGPGKIIMVSVYEVGSDHSSNYPLARVQSRWDIGKSELEELLLAALEKYDAKQASG